MSGEAKAIVELRDVGVVYPGGIHALEHISLEVYDGDFVGVMGPNGAGKSTLLNVLLGLTPPSSGSVRLFGQPVSGASLRKIGYVPQRTIGIDVNFPSTVYETVLLGRVPHAGLFHRLTNGDYRAAEEALTLLGIADLRNRKIGQLSGGQFQRVLVAKALAGKPKLLILDEPTSGVDTASRAGFYETLGVLNKEKKITIILSSHDVAVVTKLANRVICLNGSLFFCDHTSELTGEILSSMYEYQVELMKHHDHP
jgi:zinc transport system ATP-binding protein